MDWSKILSDVLALAVSVLVPALIALAVAYLKAWTKKINSEVGRQAALAVVIEVERASLAAASPWTGEEKKQAAEARLREDGVGFAIPYIEWALVQVAYELQELAAKQQEKQAALAGVVTPEGG
jgi:hypothetical protein